MTLKTTYHERKEVIYDYATERTQIDAFFLAKEGWNLTFSGPALLPESQRKDGKIYSEKECRVIMERPINHQ